MSSTNNSYETWEFTYFPHLLKMYEIFYETKKINPEIFTNFSKFIYLTSSKKILKISMSPEEEDFYTQFLIKRNN